MTTSIHHELARLRTDIERTRDEIDWLNVAQVPKDELKARIVESCKALAEQFNGPSRLGFLTHPAAGPMEMQAMFRTSTRVFIHGGPDVTSADFDVGPMLAWAMGDTLIKRLHAEVDCFDYRPGPPMAERPARLGELKAAMRALEQQEEALICRGEESGVYVPRRADADPAVVLAYEPDGKTYDPAAARAAGIRAAWDGDASESAMAIKASVPSPATEPAS